MKWERYKRRPLNFANIDVLDTYPLEQLIDDLARHKMLIFKDDDPTLKDEHTIGQIFYIFKAEIRQILESNVAGGTLKRYEGLSNNTQSSIFLRKKKNEIHIKLSEFASWAINNKLYDYPIEFLMKAPEECLDTQSLQHVEIPYQTLTSIPMTSEEQDLLKYEDVLSDETILKLMELPLPKMKQQVAMLAAEKKKTDAAVMASAKIGLLFYEEGLQKPTTEKQFLDEYKKHIDKLPSLPDTTIKRIYKNLPEGYRASRDGGKLASDQTDLNQVIKAAVYAGSIYDTDDVKVLNKLKSELVENEYELPSDNVLKKMIEAVKDI